MNRVRWHTGKNHLVGGDLTHPTADGAQTVGVILFGALVEGYAQYRARATGQPATTLKKK